MRKNDGCRSCDPSNHSDNAILRLGQLPLAVAAIVSCVLSVGLVAAVIMFIYLCFQKPDAANIVIPLIMVSLGPVLTRQGKLVMNKMVEKAKPIAVDKPDGSK